MKKISNTIRIGIVRRPSLIPKIYEKESPPNVQEEINHISIKEKRSETLGSQVASLRDEPHDAKHISRLASPNNVGLRDIKETNINNPQNAKMLQPTSSLSSPSLRKETVTNLPEIPSKTKWLTKKKIVIGVTVTAALVAVIVVAVVLAVVLTRSTNITSTTTTVVPRPVISAYWGFANTSTDLYGIYDGQLINGPTYNPSSSATIPYVGYDRALNLVATSNQSVLVLTPFLDLTYRSFTIEVWIYPISISNDRGIFGQCQCSTCTNQCLYFISRSGRLHIDFTGNYLTGSTSISANNWYHVAFVYNYETQQQILYLNGVQDAIKNNVQPYQGINGSIQIGSTQVYSTTNFFNGFIDNMFIITQAKSATDILRDASLVAYYSFDLPNQNLDNGPSGLNGTLVNTITITGRVNQAIRIFGLSAYFQVYGLYNAPYGISGTRPFSISMWIYPTSGSSSTFVQFFPTSLVNTTCTNFLGILSPTGTGGGQIFVQSTNNGPSVMSGPFVPVYTWTHISLTFSSTNGYTLYTNGIAFGATGAMTYSASSTYAYLFVGYSGSSCTIASVNSAFQGAIDELYIHNRELPEADVTVLANL